MMFKKTAKSLWVSVVLAICFFILVTNGIASTIPIFINEIHYDNDGTDAGEAIEIFGPAGSDLSGWSLELYNGGGGAVYGTLSLSGSIPPHQNGHGTLSFDYTGLQNVALTDWHWLTTIHRIQQWYNFSVMRGRLQQLPGRRME